MSVATTTAIGIAAGVGAAGSIASSAIGSNAASNAAQTQAQSNQNALAFQQQVFNTDLQNEQPFLDLGKTGASQLQSALPSLTQGFDPAQAGLPSQFSYNASDFTQDPGYQFALQQGQQAIERSAAARGGDVSGGTLKSLDAYTTGMADQDYGNAYNRAENAYQQNYSNAFNTFESNQSNTFNRLNSLVNTGQAAAGQTANAGANYANNAGQYTIGAGNALAAGTVGSSNAITSGVTGATSSISNAALLNQILNGNNGSSYVDTNPANQTQYLSASYASDFGH